MKTFTEKIEFIGNVIKFTEFSYPQSYDYRTQPRDNRGEDTKKEDKELNRSRVLFRARRRFFNLCALNFFELNKFLTITFANDTYTTPEIANPAFKNFIDKIRKTHDAELKYIAAIELQRRGVIHYHILLKMKFMDFPDLLSTWGLGSCWIKKIPDDSFSTQEYVAKYVGKGLEKYTEGGGSAGHKKVFLHSRNLKRSYPLYRAKDGIIKKRFDDVVATFDKRFETAGTSEYVGCNDYTGKYKIITKTFSRNKTSTSAFDSLAQDFIHNCIHT